MPRSKSPAPGKSRKKPIENYEHKDKQRANNPPVGLVTPETDRDAGKQHYACDPHLDPQLVWAGKAEHGSFEVPTVSLHVHEPLVRCSDFGIDRVKGARSARTAMR
jgi:adenine-specific DNA-methyltransferase